MFPNWDKPPLSQSLQSVGVPKGAEAQAIERGRKPWHSQKGRHHRGPDGVEVQVFPKGRRHKRSQRGKSLGVHKGAEANHS